MVEYSFYDVVDTLRDMKGEIGELARKCSYSEIGMWSNPSEEVVHVTLGLNAKNPKHVDVTFKQIVDHIEQFYYWY